MTHSHTCKHCGHIMLLKSKSLNITVPNGCTICGVLYTPAYREKIRQAALAELIEKFLNKQFNEEK